MSTNNGFAANSRYYAIATATIQQSDGQTIACLRRRFVPQMNRFAPLQDHAVVQGDRLDNLAAQYLGDPEIFWRLCDANGAIAPDELTNVPGTIIRITLPQDLPGASNA